MAEIDGTASAMRIIVNIMYTKFSRLSRCLVLGAGLALASLGHGAVSVTLTWDRNSEPDLAGYRVHYGPLAAPYTQLLDVRTNSANLSDLVPGTTYLMAVTAYNTAGIESSFSSPIAHFATAVPPDGQRVTLDNISSRVSVAPGDSVMIGGFIIQGSTPKTVVLRALGPSLAQAGVEGALQDPVLDLRDAAGNLITSNDAWNQLDAQALLALGLAPGDLREAALVATLAPGVYSGVVHGKGAGRGIGLFELYNLDRTHGSVANISTRGRVETGDQVMIGGFIVGGTVSTKVIIRALGPSLLAEGVRNALLDPTLEVYDANGTLLSSNDNWRTTQETAIIASTVPPTDDREAAVVRTLPPGIYSAIVRGQNSSSGVALIEVYGLSD